MGLSVIPGLEWSYPLFLVIISFFKIFIGVELIYNVVLVSGIQQSESVTHISTLFKILFPYRSLEYRVEFPVLYSRFLLVIYIIYSSVYMSIPISQFILIPLVTVGMFSTFVTLFLSFKYFLRPFLSLFSFWDPYDGNVGTFNVVPEVS